MSNSKQLRGQLRQIVKEMYPELVSTELYRELQNQIVQSLDILTKRISEQLEKMDQRQKDVQSMVLREFSRPAQPDAFKIPKDSIVEEVASTIPGETI